MASAPLLESVVIKIEETEEDIEIVNNNYELYIKEEMVDVNNEQQHPNEDDVEELESDYLEVKLEVSNSMGDPELEVLRVESPAKLPHKRSRWNARKTIEPVPRKRPKAAKSKPKCKPITKRKEDAKETSSDLIPGCPNRNQFCYVCGLFAPRNCVRNLTKSVVAAFEEFFSISYVPNLCYVPEVVCEYCYRSLIGWKGKSDRHKFKYARPATWLPQTEHSAEVCYFCLTKTTGYRYTTRERIVYADVESVIKARLRSEDYATTSPTEDRASNAETFLETTL